MLAACAQSHSIRTFGGALEITTTEYHQWITSKAIVSKNAIRSSSVQDCNWYEMKLFFPKLDAFHGKCCVEIFMSHVFILYVCAYKH